MLDGVGSAGVVAMGGLGQPDAAYDRHDPVVRLGRTLQQGGRGDQERNQHATRGQSARSDAWTSGLPEAQGRLKPDSARGPLCPTHRAKVLREQLRKKWPRCPRTM